MHERVARTLFQGLMLSAGGAASDGDAFIVTSRAEVRWWSSAHAWLLLPGSSLLLAAVVKRRARHQPVSLFSL